MTNPISIYIHVPFCEKRCSYCDFFSTLSFKDHGKSYLRTLIREISTSSERKEWRDRQVKSVFLGGGTPNLYPAGDIGILLDAVRSSFNLDHRAEVTLEMNPEFISSPEEITQLMMAGVNRFSLGVQSLNDRELAFLGRLHNAGRALSAMACFKEAGADNWSADIIHSLPGQSVEDLADTLDRLLELEPPHISAYTLTREKGTSYDRDLANGRYGEMGEDDQMEQLRKLRKTLTGHGYRHYEISNYALPGRASVHNSHYWTWGDYLGVGAGAHSKNGNIRSWHPDDLAGYLKTGSDGHPDAEVETLDELTKLTEYAMFSLRTENGISTEDIGNKGFQLLQQAVHQVQEQLPEPYFLFEETKVKCNFKGWAVLDTLLQEVSAALEKTLDLEFRNLDKTG